MLTCGYIRHIGKHGTRVWTLATLIHQPLSLNPCDLSHNLLTHSKTSFLQPNQISLLLERPHVLLNNVWLKRICSFESPLWLATHSYMWSSRPHVVFSLLSHLLLLTPSSLYSLYSAFSGLSLQAPCTATSHSPCLCPPVYIWLLFLLVSSRMTFVPSTCQVESVKHCKYMRSGN